jgi:hypothetical protein
MVLSRKMIEGYKQEDAVYQSDNTLVERKPKLIHVYLCNFSMVTDSVVRDT